MKGIRTKALSMSLALGLAGMLGLGFNTASQAASVSQINSWSTTTLLDFRKKVPQANSVLSEAKGLLIFPHLYKAGLVVGGRYGEGELLINNAVAGYYNMAGLSWGWQIGGQRQSIIIAFMTEDALKKFQNSQGWDLGADATVAIIDAGTQGTISASHLNKPVLVFAVDQKGLMAGVSLQGSKITKLNKP